MAKQTIRMLLIVSALAACSSEAPRGDADDDDCKGDSCTGETPEGATEGDDDEDKDDERDAGKVETPAKDSGRPTSQPRADAGPIRGAADAGPVAKDATTPMSVGDAGGAGPVAVPSGDVKPSAGCGMAAPAGGNLTIDVMGMSRAYILTLPKTYDAKKPHKLVFAWHGLGGTAAQIARSYYGLQAQAGDSTIFVAGQGLQTSNAVGSGPGWPNTNGQDVAFVKALYAQLQGQLCIDENRVFSLGMSYGGIMSNTLGCQMGDVFRAIAPMSGSGPRGSCKGQVAVWLSNGDNDTVVSTASERMSRDFWVKANHCQMTSKAVDPSPCLAYDGCDEGNPVTWCEFAGGHTVPPFAAKAIWTFFSQF